MHYFRDEAPLLRLAGGGEGGGRGGSLNRCVSSVMHTDGNAFRGGLLTRRAVRCTQGAPNSSSDPPTQQWRLANQPTHLSTLQKRALMTASHSGLSPSRSGDSTAGAAGAAACPPPAKTPHAPSTPSSSPELGPSPSAAPHQGSRAPPPPALPPPPPGLRFFCRGAEGATGREPRRTRGRAFERAAVSLSRRSSSHTRRSAARAARLLRSWT